MVHKCAVCNRKIEEEFGKLEGTIVKARDVDGKNKFIYVCSNCQKDKDWIEKAKVKAA